MISEWIIKVCELDINLEISFMTFDHGYLWGSISYSLRLTDCLNTSIWTYHLKIKFAFLSVRIFHVFPLSFFGEEV